MATRDLPYSLHLTPQSHLLVKHAETTTTADFGSVMTRLREQPRLMSPTRRQNPQPPGLVYQSPMHCNSQYLAIWKHDTAARQTKSRFPELTKHLGMVNFSCGRLSHESPWDITRRPQQPKYSLQSTSRFSYQDPSKFDGLKGFKDQLRAASCRPVPQPAVGIVPNVYSKKYRSKLLEKRSQIQISDVGGSNS